ncbi:unnamed protein product [Adineta ricciae]|uniref:MRH domain-containing protein n=1 Tax=Adineta ricciae TaxID=249248 RepID=A0A815UY47_ADIRI|nr:unnamed protein product [Adineta ricciae]
MQSLTLLLTVVLFTATLADDSCGFNHPIYGVIDLASLGLRDGRARFQDVSPASGLDYLYSFNPCYSFREETCQNVAVCQISPDRRFSFELARQGSSSWSLDTSYRPTLNYTSGSKTVLITMVCSSADEDSLEVLGETRSNYYTMQLRSRCACWNGCGSRSSPFTTKLTSRVTTKPTTTRPSIYYNSCRYHDSRYGSIDLSTIGNTNGKSVFKDVNSLYPNAYLWSYNPCYSFSEHQCNNVAGCQIDKTNHISYPIGYQNFVYWLNMNATSGLNPTIVYPITTSNRLLKVELICDRTSSANHHLQVVGETAVGEYYMRLTSPCACWNGCKERPSRPSFDWNVWTIIGIVGSVVFLLVVIMMTCLFCSKPKRQRFYTVMSEKTPILKY